MEFNYSYLLNKNESKKITLPQLKSSCSIPVKIKLDSNHNEFDLKLVGSDTIFFLGEAYFSLNREISLDNQRSIIINSEKLDLKITNHSKEKLEVNIEIIYAVIQPNYLINTCYLIDPHFCGQILDDIQNAGKYIAKVTFYCGDPEKSFSLDIEPKFKSTEETKAFYPCYHLESEKGMIVIDNINDDNFPIEFVQNLCHYTLAIEPKDKMFITIQGFHH